MHFVYILESADSCHSYIGHSVHTDKFSGWELKMYVAFRNKEKAEAFERYLKSHSGLGMDRRTPAAVVYECLTKESVTLMLQPNKY